MQHDSGKRLNPTCKKIVIEIWREYCDKNFQKNFIFESKIMSKSPMKRRLCQLLIGRKA